jgi:exodeoxyribonuclease-5
VIEFSSDQARAFERLLEWAHHPQGVLTFGGYAGTGKTTLLSELGREMSNAKRIGFCAPTGRAASVLARKLKEAGIDLGDRHTCSTIHSLAALPVEDPDTGEIKGWKEKQDLGNYDFLVVDEASMVSQELFDMLQRFAVPILAVGDHGQLPPVMGSLSLMREPDIRLEQIHRQAESSPIIRLAHRVREGESIQPWHAEGDVIQCIPKRNWVRVLEVAYPPAIPDFYGDNPRPASSPQEQLNTIVLCHTNAVRNQFNAKTRQLLGRGSNPEDGDLVVCLKNIKYAGVFNGFRGIFHISNDDLPDHIVGDVWFVAERQRLFGRFCRHQFGRKQTFKSFAELADLGWNVSSWKEVGHLFDYAYAMTVHKAQGSEWPLVVLCKESRPMGVSRAYYQRWLYTAVTRASEKLIVLG